MCAKCMLDLFGPSVSATYSEQRLPESLLSPLQTYFKCTSVGVELQGS